MWNELEMTAFVVCFFLDFDHPPDAEVLAA
jgi:hypothetical protein